MVIPNPQATLIQFSKVGFELSDGGCHMLPLLTRSLHRWIRLQTQCSTQFGCCLTGRFSSFKLVGFWAVWWGVPLQKPRLSLQLPSEGFFATHFGVELAAAAAPSYQAASGVQAVESSLHFASNFAYPQFITFQAKKKSEKVKWAFIKQDHVLKRYCRCFAVCLILQYRFSSDLGHWNLDTSKAFEFEAFRRFELETATSCQFGEERVNVWLFLRSRWF